MKFSMTGVTGDVTDHKIRIRTSERLLWCASGLAALGGAGLSHIVGAMFR